MKTLLAVAVLAACGSDRDRDPGTKSGARPADSTDSKVLSVAAPRPKFIRVPAAKADGVHWAQRAEGEIVGNMELVGSFTCKLEALFGPPDPYVAVSTGPGELGFPLQHVATGEVIAALPEGYGIAALSREDMKPFETAANELVALLATTKPIDCEHTFAGFYRVSRAGVRQGKPFFEHLDFAPTVDFRLAEFEHNDQQEDWRRKHNIKDKLCESLRQNWSERRDAKKRIDPRLAAYPRRDEVERRLLDCLETNLADLEPEVAGDWFDYDAVPEIVDHEVESFEDLAIDDPEMKARLQRLRTTTRQKAAKLRRK